MRKQSRFSKLVSSRELTNQALAAAVGYSVPTVRAWRAGRRRPSWGAVVLLSEVLRVRPSEIVRLLDAKE